MKITVLGSGSGGNAVYLATERTKILVDAGFGIRSLRRRCQQAGIELGAIDAVVISHGHNDHISGIPSLVKHGKPQVWTNPGTRNEAYQLKSVQRLELFDCSGSFCIGDFTIQAFRTPHDAAEPVGFRIICKGITGAVATDLGQITDTIRQQTCGCDWLVLESNHDEELLRLGPYPWPLKRRVLGPNGHLSNRALAEFIATDLDGSTAHLFLAHLSRQNNHPELALASALEAVELRRSGNGSSSPRVHLTHQDYPSIVLDL